MKTYKFEIQLDPIQIEVQARNKAEAKQLVRQQINNLTPQLRRPGRPAKGIKTHSI